MRAVRAVSQAGDGVGVAGEQDPLRAAQSGTRDQVVADAGHLEAGGGGVYLGPSGPTWVVLDRLVSEEAFISSTDLADLAPEYPEVGWAELAAHLASTLEPGLSAEHPALPSSDSGQVR